MPKEKVREEKPEKKKYSLASLMEVIETELDIGDIFKFPISQENYVPIKKHVKLIEMPDTEKPNELEYFMVVKRLR